MNPKTPLTNPSKRLLSLLFFPSFLFITACMCTELPGQVLGTVQTAATAQSVLEDVRTSLPDGFEMTLQAGGNVLATLQNDPTAMAQVGEAVSQAQTSVPGIERTAQAVLADPTMRAMAEGVVGDLPAGIDLTVEAVLGGEEGLGGIFGTILEGASDEASADVQVENNDVAAPQVVDPAVDVDPAIVDGKVLGLPVILDAKDLISSDLGGNVSVTYLTATTQPDVISFYKENMLPQGFTIQTETIDAEAGSAVVIFVVGGKQVILSVSTEADGRQRVTLAQIGS